MTTQAELFDICRTKHRGNAQSNAANPAKFSKQRDRSLVYELIRDSAGITSKEIAEVLGRPLHTFSGRISELKRDQRIAVRGARDGAGILFTRK